MSGKKGSKDFHMPYRDVTESIKPRLWALSEQKLCLIYVTFQGLAFNTCTINV